MKPLGVALGVAVVQSTHLCCQYGHLIGRALLAAAPKLLAKCGAEVGAKAAGKAMAFRIGFRAATSSTQVAAGANLLFEGPLLAHSIYQLKRKKTFKMISEREYKVEVAKQGLIHGGAAVGGIAGAIAGQVAIPVPILGAAVGGAIGGFCGQMAGRAEGELVSKLVSEEDINTLPEIVQKSFICVLEL